ncbi:SDR family oxidoreductase [Rhodopirellula sp. SWK7]|uniref:SDR family oxidoreductase n=1 Tax=Rhodopirellula sp. SWK7 TaxID=595460 RepID=UPI0002BEF8D0|nr:SDR family oxidoreductase [Rhodopirellula sp. SWK7]EMI45121.1 short-chain dehydrogenase/reductase SDR [Rhodopirellula sp. SWK7]
MTFDIKNKNVLITGANRGIGKAILEEAISRRAAKVYAAVRDLDSASSLVEEYGDRIIPIHVDLDDAASIKSAAEKASDVDVVVNNAGVMKIAEAMSDDAIEALQFEMNVNVYGLMRMAHAFAPTLKSNGGGAFVQLNSVASVKTFSDFATYCASKAASYAITQGLRDSLRDQGTHVLSVHPGPIQTDMGDAAGFGDSAGSPVDVAKAIFDGIVNGNFHAWPDEVAQQVGNAYQSFAENIVEADMQESVA